MLRVSCPARQVRFLSASNRDTGDNRQHLLSEANYLLSTEEGGGGGGDAAASGPSDHSSPGRALLISYGYERRARFGLGYFTLQRTALAVDQELPETPSVVGWVAQSHSEWGESGPPRLEDGQLQATGQ